MAGEDRLIEMLLPDASWSVTPSATDNVLHRRIEAKAQAIATLSQQGAHVFARAAGHHVPLRTLADIEQAVVFKKRRNSASGKRRISCSDEDQIAAPIGRM